MYKRKFGLNIVLLFLVSCNALNLTPEPNKEIKCEGGRLNPTAELDWNGVNGWDSVTLYSADIDLKHPTDDTRPGMPTKNFVRYPVSTYSQTYDFNKPLTEGEFGNWNDVVASDGSEAQLFEVGMTSYVPQLATTLQDGPKLNNTLRVCVGKSREGETQVFTDIKAETWQP